MSVASSHHLVDSQGRTIEKNAEKTEILTKNYAKFSSSFNPRDTFWKRKKQQLRKTLVT